MIQAPTIAIIGAGFCGAVTAIQLMRQAVSPLNVILINKSGRMARGLAYGTNSPVHVLNVPAGNMSALADEPNDFLDYCRWAVPSAQAHSFVSRALYGAYLDALLSATESRNGTAGPAVLERIAGEAMDISTADDAVTIRMDSGRKIHCSAVVLAFGHFPPADILQPAEREQLGPRYITDPWSLPPRQDLSRSDDILVIGTGLTALDVITSLHDGGHQGQIVCLSRHGLMPRSHRPEGASGGSVDGVALASRMGNNLRQQIRVLRNEAHAAMNQGNDWRDVFASLRARTPGLWHALSHEDRRRFLRHVRPWWDVFRHRCAPEALDLVQQLQRDNRLHLLAGRIRGAQIAADGRAELTIRQRATGAILTRSFDAVINCTGPCNDVRRSGVPLLQCLLDKGMISPDTLGLGLGVDERYAAISTAGQVQSWLRYIGPMLKAQNWEATAVPELRAHAKHLASDLLQQVARSRVS